MYRRALPYTWTAAAAARWLGVDHVSAYRIPAAFFGVLTIPLLFIMGRRLVGVAPALTAATLLTFSERHIAFSRERRMYVPFLFFYLAAAWAFWGWSRSQRRVAVWAHAT